MKLYLDDIRDPYVGWDLARNYDAAVAMVLACEARGETWEHASLDHDLAFEHYDAFFEGRDPDSFREKTGMDFVDWMVMHNKWPINKPTVHSANPVGKRRMEMTIERYGPYGRNI